MICWQSLLLEGFGRFARPVRLDLAPGVNVLVADNEQGKSTLAAGLSAVLFGLQGGERTLGFTDGRYRSWYRADSFRGALSFERSGQAYLIERDFAARKVRLLEGTSAGWRTTAEERHHAGAERRGRTYAAAIANLLGIGDRQLFEATFFLTQPLPPIEGLDAAIQGLLSGGGGEFAGALGQLEAELREITRFTVKLGVTGRDAHLDRPLEVAKQTLAQRQAELEAGRALVDSLEVLSRHLSAAREEQRQTAQAAAAARDLEAAWHKWVAQRNAYHAAVAAQLAGNKALTEANNAAAAVGELQESLASYPEAASITAGAEGKLTRLQSLEMQIEQLEQARSELERVAGERREALAKLTADLDGQYRQVRERPQLPALWDRLAALDADLQQKRQRYSELLAARQQAAAAVEAGADWSQLGPAPAHALGRLRQSAQQVLVGWEQLTRQAAALREVETEIETGYPHLAAAGNLDELASAARCLTVLSADWQRLDEVIAHHPDLAELPDLRASGRAAEQRLSELTAHSRSMRGTQGDPARGRSLRRVVPAVGGSAAGGALVSALVWWVTRGSAGIDGYPSGLVWAVAGALAAALLTTALYLRLGSSGSSIGITQRTSAVAAVADELPPGWAELELGELYQQERRLSTVITEAGALVPDGAGLREALASIQSRLVGLQERLGPLPPQVLAAPGELESVVQHYRRVRERQSALAAEVQSSLWSLGLVPARDTYGQAGDLAYSGIERRMLDWPERVTGHWLELRALARVQGHECCSPASLVEWLRHRDDDGWWAACGRRAAEWEELAAEIERTEGRLADFGSLEGDVPGRIAALEAEVRQATAQLTPFSLSTPREHLAELVAGCAAAESELASGRRLLARDEEESQRLAARLREARSESAALRLELAALLEAAGGDLAVAANRLSALAGLLARRSQLEGRLAGALRSQGVDALEQLELAKLRLDSRVASVSDAWDRLISDHPALPPRDLAEDAAHIDAAARRITAFRAQAAVDAEDAAQKVSSLLEERARVEASTAPPNLVLLTAELAQLQRDIRQLELQAGALALAHREIGQAIREYQASYRERLAHTATVYFRSLSGAGKRSVVLDEEFAVRVEDGQLIHPAVLSQGTQDQLFVALRLAIADLLTDRVALPLICDDPFLTFDEQRTEAMRGTLERLGRSRQVILLTHRRELAGWGQAVAPQTVPDWPSWEVGC